MLHPGSIVAGLIAAGLIVTGLAWSCASFAATEMQWRQVDRKTSP